MKIMSMEINVPKPVDMAYCYGMLLRSSVIAKFRKGQHQMIHNTEYDRYPKIFTICEEYSAGLNPSKELKILSFGCSTGEECMSIRKYFPSAKIFGVDIDKSTLDSCNKRNKDPNISFMYSNFQNIKKEGPFDMIFCMSVLCRWPDTKYLRNITNIYNFLEFQNTIEEIDKVLVKNGLLVVYNSNFIFSDTSIYSKYQVLYDPQIVESGFVYKFDKNNNRVKESQYKECIFIKKRENNE